MAKRKNKEKKIDFYVSFDDPLEKQKKECTVKIETIRGDVFVREDFDEVTDKLTGNWLLLTEVKKNPMFGYIETSAPVRINRNHIVSIRVVEEIPFNPSDFIDTENATIF